MNKEICECVYKERYCINCGKSETEIRLEKRITRERVNCISKTRYTHKYKLRKLK